MADRPAWQQRDEQRIRDLEQRQGPLIWALVIVVLIGGVLIAARVL